MPVYIEQMTSEVTVVDGDMPLTPQQIEQLVQLVVARLEDKQRTANLQRATTAIRNSSVNSNSVER